MGRTVKPLMDCGAFAFADGMLDIWARDVEVDVWWGEMNM